MDTTQKILRSVALPFVVLGAVLISSTLIHFAVVLLYGFILVPSDDATITVNGKHPLADLLSRKDAEYLGYSLVNPGVVIVASLRWLKVKALRPGMHLSVAMCLWCLIAPLVLRSGLLPIQSSDSVLLALVKAAAGVCSSIQGGYTFARLVMRERALASADTSASL